MADEIAKGKAVVTVDGTDAVRDLKSIGEEAKNTKGEIGDLGRVSDESMHKAGIGFADLKAGAVALTAAIVGAAGVAAGLKDLADQAVDTRARLVELGGVMAVPESATRSLALYRSEVQKLSADLGDAKFAAGALAAGELGTLAVTTEAAAAAATEAYREWTSWLNPLHDISDYAQDGARAIVAVSTAGASEAMILAYDRAHDLSGAYADVAVFAQRAAEASRDAALANNRLGDIVGPVLEDGGPSADRQREIDQWRADSEEWDKSYTQLQIDNIRDVLSAQEEADRAVSADAARVRNDMLADNQALIDSTEALADARTKSAADQVLVEQRKAEIIRGYELDTVNAALDAFGTLEDSVIRGYQARIEAGEQMNYAETQQYNQAVFARKALAITAAGINAAEAGVEAVAQLTPLLTPVGAAVAGTAFSVALFAAGVAAIESESPLRFQWDIPEGAHEQPGGEAQIGSKGGHSVDEVRVNARSSGGSGGSTNRVTVGLDARLSRLSVRVDTRPGKKPRRGGR